MKRLAENEISLTRTLRIPKSTWTGLKMLARELGTDRSTEIRKAVDARLREQGVMRRLKAQAAKRDAAKAARAKAAGPKRKVKRKAATKRGRARA